jgi:sigma-B regulation protein RsbU (phosphoserine phosphatase)
MLGVMEFFSREVRRPDPELLQMMVGLSSQISQFIERRQAERALHERAGEFALARSIQLKLLPKAPPACDGFAIGGASLPAHETGGDYLDFIPLSDGSLGIAIGDASGHGIGAALVMAETRAFLRARATTDSDVGRILTLVNRQLCADLPADHFVTLLFACLNAQTRTLTYSSAGHWPGYVLDEHGQVRRLLESTSFPLGIDSAAEFPVAPPVDLQPGELVLFLTDGILEASSPDGQLFGVGRTLDAIRAYREDSPEGIVAVLLRTAQEFAPDAQVDDMTAVVLKIDAT